MTIERRTDSLGRFLAGVGFALALLGLSSSAAALNILFKFDDKVSAEAKVVIKQTVREYNDGIKDDATMLVEFGSCWNYLDFAGERSCRDCFGRSRSNRFSMGYAVVRQALAEQVCGTATKADAGCKQATSDASGNDVQTFRTGMWPNQHINPINQAVDAHSTASEIIINSVNARVLGFCGGSHGSRCGSSDWLGSGELGAPMDAQAAETKVKTVCNSQPDQCYWGMCTEKNRSWCTAGAGEFMQHANFQYPDSQNVDALMWFNWNGGSDSDWGCFSGSDDAVTVLHHELNEAIGLGSSCHSKGDSSPDTCYSTPRMQDMFRYKSTCPVEGNCKGEPLIQRSWSVEDKTSVYFSTDNGSEALAHFNTNQSKQGTTVTKVSLCWGNGKHFASDYLNELAENDENHCLSRDCTGGDYGDWFSCPANWVGRDQDAWDQTHSEKRLAWTALDIQGFTLTHPETWEGFIAHAEAKSATCGNGVVEAGEQCDSKSFKGESSEACCLDTCQIDVDNPQCSLPTPTPQEDSVAHHQINAQRSNTRCHLGLAAKTLRGQSADASTCDASFKETTDKIARVIGPHPGFGDLGPHIIENKNWTAAIVLATEAEPRSLNSRCAVRLVRAVSKHLRCEGKAQLRELRGRDATRRRDRCDRRLERHVDRLEARYEGAASCTANFEANDIILTSREGFMGEIDFFQEIAEP